MKYNFIFAFLFLLVFLDQIQTIKQNNKPLTTVDTSYHWKLVKVKDIPNYPEYETNGVGPRHTEESPRFSQLKTEEPPHPSMTDTVPESVVKMEENMIRMMGIPKAERSKQNYSSIDELSAMKLPHKTIEQDFRFAQIENQDKDFSNMPMDGTGWDTITFNTAWASSVYTYSWWWYYHSYPASNAIHGNSYWCSTGGHSSDQIVTWQGDFDRPKRIGNLLIRWAYAPGEVSIQTTSDGSNWEERIPWKTCSQSMAWQGGSFFNHAFSATYEFDEPIWVQGVRVLMRKPNNYYFAIYQVKAWTKQWISMLKSAEMDDVGEQCLSLRNGQYQNGQDIYLRNCIDSISQLDSRENFVLQNNLQVTSYRQDLCIESSNGVLEKHAKIQVWNCNECANTRDNREKWLLDPKGYMKILKDTSKCLTIVSGEINLQEQPGVSAEATSTLNDGQHEPKTALDGTENNYWASSPGVETVGYKVSFPKDNVKEIEITWKYIPEKFEIMGFTNGYWRSFGIFSEVDKAVSTIKIGLKSLDAIKIMLYKAGEKSRFNGQVIYGISGLKIKSGAKKVSLRDCNAESTQNKWLIDDVNFVDTETSVKIAYEFSQLYQNSNRLLDLLAILTNWPPKINLMIAKAKILQGQISSFESELIELDLKLEQYKASNLAEEEEERKKVSSLGAVGSSSGRPASSCSEIKTMFPYKMTGFYWLKPECSKFAIRAFCDYTSFKSGMDYAYFGGLRDDVIKGNQPKNIDDVRYMCAKLGLYPVELRTKEQISQIHKYLTDIGLNLQSKGMVPLGYDYGCETSSCSGRYLSLNSKSSKDFSDVLKQLVDKKNILMQSFSKALNGKADTLIGFGLSKKGGFTGRFLGSVPIKGVVCSSNAESKNEDAWIKADCETRARGNSDFDGETNTNFKVLCPAGCLNAGTGKVIGNEIYTDDSAICKAAIHNGQISPELGGRIEVVIETGRDTYESSESNGIRSEALETKWDRSILLNRFGIRCPIENFKSRVQSSFLEVEDSISENSEFIGGLKNLAKSTVDNIGNKAKGKAAALTNNLKSSAGNLVNQAKGIASSAQNTITQAAGNVMDQAQNTVNSAVNSVNDAYNTAKNAVGDVSNTVSDAYNQAKDSVIGTANNIADSGNNLLNQAGNAVNNFLGGGQGGQQGSQGEEGGVNAIGAAGSTMEANIILADFFRFDKSNVIKQIKLVEDTTKLLDALQSQYGPLISTDQAPDAQLKYLDTVSAHLKGTIQEMDRTINKAESKLKKKRDLYRRLAVEKLKYQRYDPFVEKYDVEIFDTYKSLDFKQANNGPSSWRFSKSSLNGHATAIGQTSAIAINVDLKERYATHLKFKFRNYFDGVLRVSFLGKEQGRVGIAFRYIDQFNFYVFEMFRGVDGSGFKRIRKFVNGEPTVLATEKDGGYLQDKWYRIVIHTKMSKFSVYMEEENENNVKPEGEEKIPKVIEAYDGDFAEGFFAFLVNGVAGAYFDSFSLTPSSCINNNKVQDDKIYVPPTASRFKESFSTDLNLIWKSVEPENSKNGPAAWAYKSDFNGKKVVRQASLIMGGDSSKSPALLEMRLEKVCRVGIIQTTFMAENKNGVVGIAFHYSSSKNYFIFEIVNEGKSTYCQLRKVIDGSAKLIQKSEEGKGGYEPNKWYSVTIKLANSNFYFYLSKEGEGLFEVLKIEADFELSSGSIALASFGVKVGFADIIMGPASDFEFGEEDPKGQDNGNKLNVEDVKPEEVKPPVSDTKIGVTPVDKNADHEVCLEKKSPLDRDKYCLEKFQDDLSALSDCKKNFCDRCCDDNIDSIHSIKRYQCKKDCNSLSQNDKKSDEWEMCITSPRPNFSIYQFCESNQNSAFEKSRCKIDFCNLCCALSSNVFSKKFDDISVNRCHKKCIENFGDELREAAKGAKGVLIG